MGVPVAEEGTEAGVDHHRNQCNEQDQVYQTGNIVKSKTISLSCFSDNMDVLL